MKIAYYLPHSGTGWLEKGIRFITKRELPLWSFPRNVQIQTIAGCNARCVFCPNGKLKRAIPRGSMEWDLYRSIVDECTRHRVLRISPYLMNEPLLDREIGERIRYISSRRRWPTYTKINTNASLLTEEVARDLLDSGLDVLACSVHGITREKYEEAVKGLSLDEVLENIDRFLSLKERLKKRKPELRITMIRTKLIETEIEKIHAYWWKRKVRVSIRPMSNRAHESLSALNLTARPLLPFVWCHRLFEQIYVNVRGELLRCCNDWEQTTIFGDLKKQSIEEVWLGEAYMEMRRRFLAGKVRGTLCEQCLMQPE